MIVSFMPLMHRLKEKIQIATNLLTNESEDHKITMNVKM